MKNEKKKKKKNRAVLIDDNIQYRFGGIASTVRQEEARVDGLGRVHERLV
jgi:hypothetical protein